MSMKAFRLEIAETSFKRIRKMMLAEESILPSTSDEEMLRIAFSIIMGDHAYIHLSKRQMKITEVSE